MAKEKKTFWQKLKKGVKGFRDTQMMHMMSVGQTTMYYDYLQVSDYWNPNAIKMPAFDADYPVPALQSLIERFIPDMGLLPNHVESGEKIFLGEYRGYTVLLTFSLHNARLLKISVNMPVEDENIEKKYNSLAEKFNPINESDELIQIGIIKPDSTIVCTFSTIVLITDTFGDENDIIKGYDNLIDFGIALLNDNANYKSLLNNFQPPYPEYISDLEELDSEEDNDGIYNSALTQWFGKFTNVVYPDSKVEKDDRILSRSFLYPGRLEDNHLFVAIQDAENAVEISGIELEHIKLSVSKDTPIQYKIEARDLRQLICDTKEIQDWLTLDFIKKVCIDVNARMHNLLVKCFWYEKDGIPNFSLVAYGLHFGKGNTWAKIDVLGEFLKIYATIKAQINY